MVVPAAREGSVEEREQCFLLSMLAGGAAPAVAQDSRRWLPVGERAVEVVDEAGGLVAVALPEAEGALIVGGWAGQEVPKAAAEVAVGCALLSQVFLRCRQKLTTVATTGVIWGDG